MVIHSGANRVLCIESILRINMPLYKFVCESCSYEAEEIFPASEWDRYISQDDYRKYKKCLECKEGRLRLSIGDTMIMGGSTGYMSMERYWSKNPEIKEIGEEKMHHDAKRVKNFKNEMIKRQKRGEQIAPRIKHKK
jgi:hypothetical protein